MSNSYEGDSEGIDARTVYRNITGNQESPGNHVYQLIRDGRFPIKTYRVGRRVMVSRRDYERFLESQSGMEGHAA